ncbi:bifunctional alpha/beta hydrolase/class I SAM-dependent methyltransferase [Accumulibacter sp.]|uniref:bifunctional alpha/beta hydrolase/class I SAM-dependent methyltransferase n=1 Tax=Accumulibacter sp. TaxID=2053492 RepID=UPI0025DCA6F0|nr:bifunctional alpha/beta hydrolase/class I SAM-dependent methyltransferase [Accumulibacter sp.]MCM8611913.1 bifunctional alpha/beta hydrolase/class I SAM-dependent methyltransferase [Accumulibacter sp.]MCM8635535.1 bifunctional alpha/beta hydrolase/class I SAM-dependent methyltransferase [Accumulibacter sp.]MCM8639113.1 bifunctional alpha/beta hydrolase/class I SAM-dependent methyltransferase [Accumulibacter sp.]
MRQAVEGQFTTHDGSRLFYRHWPPRQAGSTARALILLHRGHEHSGRLQHVVDELGLDEFALFAWDARGHGRSPGTRGDSPGFAALVRDLDAFVTHVSDVCGIAIEDIALIGQSVGAVIAATWVHDYAPRLRCLVLTAPAFEVRLYVPLARPGLALMRRLFGNFFITSYVKARFLTHDPQRIASYDEDPLITRNISARVLLELADAADRVVADAQAIRVPLQLLIPGNDWVVHRRPQERFFERLGSPVKECHLLPGFLHDTLGERERRLPLAAIRAFIERMFAAPPAADSLLQADRFGHTRDEERRLGQPLPLLSPRRLGFAGTRLAMRTLGRLSEGIATGLRTGFDSGSSLDHVYRNQARGRLLLGRLIDRGYLDSIGWRGIRIRRTHLLVAIANAAARLRAAGRPIRVFDPAAGHGRYLVEAVQALPERPQSLLLRDLDAANVAQAQALLEAAGFAGIARCETGDAFAEAALAAIRPQPNLVTVSGLYELFSDNQLVASSLRGLAQAVERGGYLIYTGQPWHPQLELIARTLTSHRGHQPWIMRRRTQAEIDELVRVAGFSKLAQWIDDWGMFSVSLARRD